MSAPPPAPHEGRSVLATRYAWRGFVCFICFSLLFFRYSIVLRSSGERVAQPALDPPPPPPRDSLGNGNTAFVLQGSEVCKDLVHLFAAAHVPALGRGVARGALALVLQGLGEAGAAETPWRQDEKSHPKGKRGVGSSGGRDVEGGGGGGGWGAHRQK